MRLAFSRAVSKVHQVLENILVSSGKCICEARTAIVEVDIVLGLSVSRKDNARGWCHDCDWKISFVLCAKMTLVTFRRDILS